MNEAGEPSTHPKPTVLVPVAVHGEASLPGGTAALLANARVVVAGYYEVPEQTATEQAREQFGESAKTTLHELAATLADVGATVETRLVFTHEAATTIDRIVYEHDCLAVLVANHVERVDDVLLAVRGLVGLEQNAALVAGLFADRGVDVTVYHGRDADEPAADARGVVTETEWALRERGMKASTIETVIEQTNEPVAAIARQAADHDVVVMGETNPSVTTVVFGMPADRVAERFEGPVLVVQRPRPET